jgi:hypothetical protein
MDRTVVRQRALALGLGGVLTVGAIWGALWVLLLVVIAGQPPDPTAADPDLCCPVPDTWGETLGSSALALVLGLADAAVVAVGAALLVYGFRLRWPPRSMVLAVPAAVAVYAALIVLGVGIRAVV